MPDVIAPRHSLPAPVHPPAIALRELWPWTLFGIALLAVAYMVGVEEGAMSLSSGGTLHEWLHDGRHLLGFPCH
jgi:hypothetical protein